MKLVRSLVTCLALSLPLAGVTLASPVQAAPNSSSDRLAPLPFWLVELMTDQLAHGGWSCACTPISEGNTILADYKFGDEVEHDDRHAYNLINRSDYEIPVILTLTNTRTGESQGQFEVLLAPRTAREISTTFWLSEDVNSEVIRTTIKTTIPEAAEDIQNPGFPPVLIQRYHIYAQPNRPDELITGAMKCDSSGCKDHIDGAIGNCAGPSFHLCE